MKKVKQANGYIVYQATTQRDADNYNCQVGNYNVYIAQDIRDFGLGNSYPEYEDIDSLAVALVYCNGSRYAVAVALADELSSSTVQDMDLVLEIERRLDEGEALNTIRRCYDRENDRLYASITEAINDGFDPYANGIDFDPYEDHPAMAYDEDGELHVIDDEDEWSDDEDLDQVIEDLAAGKLDDAPEQQPEKHWTVHRNEYRNVYYYCDCCGCTIGKYQTMHCAESTEGDFMVFCDRCIGKQDFLRPEPAEQQPEQEHRSHASYAALRDPDDGQYFTISAPFTEGLDTQKRRDDWLLCTVAKHIAFSDCGGYDVQEIVIDGRPVEYVGWQPGMLYEFADCETKEIIWSASFPEWDH